MKTAGNAVKAFYRTHRFGIWFAVIAFTMFAMVLKGVMQLPQIEKNRETIEALQDEIEYEQRRIEEIEELKGKVSSDEYIEKIAREKLGYIKQDEKVFIDISKQDTDAD